MNPKWIKRFIASRIGLENRMMKLNEEWNNANLPIQSEPIGLVDNAGEQVRPVNAGANEGQSGSLNPLGGNGDQRP